MKNLVVCAMAIWLLSIPGLTRAQTDIDAKVAAKGAIAPSDKKPEEGPWSGALAAGYARTSGNSDSSSTSIKGEGRYDQDRWHHILGATAVATSSAPSRGASTDRTGEAYWAGFQSQYDFTDAVYGFGSVDWYKDRFSAYDYQLFETVGAGWRVFRGEVHFLDLEAGYGLRQSKSLKQVAPPPALPVKESENEGVALLRALYTWQVSDTAAFRQKISVLDSKSNTYLESNSELKAAIAGNLSAVLGYTVKHNSDIENIPGEVPFEKQDTLTTVSLQYNFK